jgi:Ser/Thr protein kinase RdoA (MazF antagonist)
MTDRDAHAALDAWSLDRPRLEPMSQGNINRSYLVEDASQRRFVLQWVSPIFEPSVCDDIARVTEHLEQRGVLTPRLISTADGHTRTTLRSGTWRLLSYVDGRTFARVQERWQAEEAGRSLARFHRAMTDFGHPFASQRLGVHDLQAHLSGLEAAFDRHVDHPHRSEVAPLAEAILRHADALPALPETAERVVHGDPKLANLVFEPEARRARAWIDLDTIAYMRLPLELGDAFRSWCQGAEEDGAGSSGQEPFDLKRFEAGCRGYHEAGAATDVEWRAFPAATEIIALELAARFCRDAFETTYFGWDPARYPDASTHHRVRAENQLALTASVRRQRERADAIVDRILDGS